MLITAGEVKQVSKFGIFDLMKIWFSCACRNFKIILLAIVIGLLAHSLVGLVALLTGNTFPAQNLQEVKVISLFNAAINLFLMAIFALLAAGFTSRQVVGRFLEKIHIIFGFSIINLLLTLFGFYQLSSEGSVPSVIYPQNALLGVGWSLLRLILVTVGSFILTFSAVVCVLGLRAWQSIAFSLNFLLKNLFSVILYLIFHGVLVSMAAGVGLLSYLAGTILAYYFEYVNVALLVNIFFEILKANNMVYTQSSN